jgi:hypothetical protein
MLLRTYQQENEQALAQGNRVQCLACCVGWHFQCQNSVFEGLPQPVKSVIER